MDQKNLSHTDRDGRARMVDVGHKVPQRRRATATGRISLSPEALTLVGENQIKKGDVLTVAQIAGIQAAKRTAELIPLCHTLTLDKIGLELRITDDGVAVESQVMCVGRTGAEMEALTAVSVALLTVYDMCKAVDKQMKIGEITLVTKEKHDVL